MNRRLFLVYALTFFALLVLSVLTLSLGAVPVPVAELLSALRSSARDNAYTAIVRYVRLPRLCGGIASGAALASSGAIIQTVLRNPLGSPTVLGMNAGAAFLVVVAAAFAPAGFVPLAAFLGAFGTLLLVCALGRAAGGSRSAVVLSGVAASTFLTALADGMTVLIPDTVYGRTAFKIGSLSGVQFSQVAPAALVIVCALFLSFLLRDCLDVLSLGDDTASALGLPVVAVRMGALAVASLLCGAGISFAGLVGFVGLIVPHIARLLAGAPAGRLLPLSAFLGADLVLLCDLLSRLVFAPYELPVGILLSLIGGPFFVVLVLRRRMETAHG